VWLPVRGRGLDLWCGRKAGTAVVGAWLESGELGCMGRDGEISDDGHDYDRHSAELDGRDRLFARHCWLGSRRLH
jgi:hypothetical protein